MDDDLLADDGQFKDEGLDELGIDEEAALLGSSDEDTSLHGDPELEYVDEDGNPVDMREGNRELYEVAKVASNKKDIQDEDVLELDLDSEIESFAQENSDILPKEPVARSSYPERKHKENLISLTQKEKHCESPDLDKTHLHYSAAVELYDEESEDESMADDHRERFKSERSNIITLTPASKRADIPDTLESVICQEENAKVQAFLENEQKRKMRFKDRHARNNSPRFQRPQQQYHEPSQSQQFHLSNQEPIYQQTPQPRKILINPHFRGIRVPPNEQTPSLPSKEPPTTYAPPQVYGQPPYSQHEISNAAPPPYSSVQYTAPPQHIQPVPAPVWSQPPPEVQPPPQQYTNQPVLNYEDSVSHMANYHPGNYNPPAPYQDPAYPPQQINYTQPHLQPQYPPPQHYQSPPQQMQPAYNEYENNGGNIQQFQNLSQNSTLNQMQGQNQHFQRVQPDNQHFVRPRNENQSFTRPQPQNQHFVRPQNDNTHFTKSQSANQRFERPQFEKKHFSRPQTENHRFQRQQNDNQHFSRPQTENQRFGRVQGEKRPSNTTITQVPVKRSEPLQSRKENYHVNKSNIREIPLVDSLPSPDEEDEKTKELRLKIEEQKLLREQILKRKEERRRQMATQRMMDLKQRQAGNKNIAAKANVKERIGLTANLAPAKKKIVVVRKKVLPPQSSQPNTTVAVPTPPLEQPKKQQHIFDKAPAPKVVLKKETPQIPVKKMTPPIKTPPKKALQERLGKRTNFKGQQNQQRFNRPPMMRFPNMHCPEMQRPSLLMAGPRLRFPRPPFHPPRGPPCDMGPRHPMFEPEHPHPMFESNRPRMFHPDRPRMFGPDHPHPMFDPECPPMFEHDRPHMFEPHHPHPLFEPDHPRFHIPGGFPRPPHCGPEPIPPPHMRGFDRRPRFPPRRNPTINQKKEETVVKKDGKETQQQQQPPPKQETEVPKSESVSVENLSSSTTVMQLKKLCSSVGAIEKIQLMKESRKAIIKFKESSHALNFQKKYQRYMLDLAMIQVSLIPS